MRQVDVMSQKVIDAVNEGWPKTSPFPTNVMDVWMPPSGKFWKAIGGAFTDVFADLKEFRRQLTLAGIEN